MRLPLFIPIERKKTWARLLCRVDVIGLILRADGRFGIRRADGSHDDADVDASTTVSPFLIVLRYRQAGRVESLVLPCSATGPEAHRRLRVWLRCRARTGVSVSA